MAAARQKLLDTALLVIRMKGYAATTIDELCKKAGVAKGSFFRHFKDTEALAITAAEYWSEMTAAFFEVLAFQASRIAGQVSQTS